MPGLLCRAEVTKVERLGVVEPAEQPAEPPAEPHPLCHAWYMWEHTATKSNKQLSWGDSMRELASFDTVEAFWRLWAHVPSPSKIFGAGGGDKRVEALSIFIAGIRPEWEDKMNAAGSAGRGAPWRDSPAPAPYI